MKPHITVIISEGDDELLERVTNSFWSIARKAAKAGREVPFFDIYQIPEIKPVTIGRLPGGIVSIDPVGEEKKK